jgi:hypothetical protein
LRSTENYVNKKLRCRCDLAARWLARQARGNNRLKSHSIETPEASQPTKVLRCSQFANVQAFDEDNVKDERTVREREIAGPPRDGLADSPDGSAEDIDFLMDDIEGLLSCPHANSIFRSETQIARMQFSAMALERPIAIALCAITALDCNHFICFSRLDGAN